VYTRGGVHLLCDESFNKPLEETLDSFKVDPSRGAGDRRWIGRKLLKFDPTSSASEVSMRSRLIAFSVSLPGSIALSMKPMSDSLTCLPL
jgi:hypothetical protein